MIQSLYPIFIILSSWSAITIANHCLLEYIHMDVVILADTSCPMTDSQCTQQQQRIAKTLLHIKGPDDDKALPTVRVAYIEFGSNDTVDIVVPLNEWPYNSGKQGITNETMMEYYHLIEERCENITGERKGAPALESAIRAALEEFDTPPKSDDLRKDKKILIFSNCGVSDVESLCSSFELHKQGNAHNVEFFMVSIGENIEFPETYAMCLVEYDPSEVWSDTERNDDVFYGEIVEGIQLEMCDHPTPSPTVDPTSYVDCYDQMMDIVILVDTATPMSYVECREQQEHVAYAMLQFKGIEDCMEVPNVRVSVIEVGTDDVYVRVSLDEYPYNRDTGANSKDTRMELYDLICRSGECYIDAEEEILSRTGNQNLYDGLICALNQFDFDDTTRNKYILIYSNSMTNSTEKVCEFYTENNEAYFSNVDIFMFEQYSVVKQELECLVNDIGNIWNNPTRDNRIYTQKILPALKQEMCTTYY